MSNGINAGSTLRMEEVEEELQKMHEETGSESKLGLDSITDEVLDDESELVQETDINEQTELEEESNIFTYQVLQKEAKDVKLPSSLWAMHKDPNGRFVAFSRLPAARTGRLVADKGVVFAESLVPSVFFKEMKLKLPIGVPTQPLESVDQVSAYLHKIHRLAFCTGTGLNDPIRSMKCRIYVDMPSSVKQCTACCSQRQAVIAAAQLKKT